MIDTYGKRGREFGDFALPVGHERGRYNDKCLGFGQFAVVFELKQCGDHLQCLSEPHVVGNQGADAETKVFHEPRKAASLIWAKRGVKVLRR